MSEAIDPDFIQTTIVILSALYPEAFATQNLENEDASSASKCTLGYNIDFDAF